MKTEERKKLIMRKAEGVFSSKRFHEITLDDVAVAARIGKGTIYRYFESKEELYTRTVVSGIAEITGLLDRNVPWGAPFRDQLEAACKQISEFYCRRQSLFRMMQAEEVRFSGRKVRYHGAWSEHSQKFYSMLDRIIQTGIDEGAVHSEIPPRILGLFLLGMLRTRMRNTDLFPEDLRGYEALVDFFLTGASGAEARPVRTAKRGNR